MKRKRKVELLPQLVESIITEKDEVFIFLADLCGSTEFKLKCRVAEVPDSTWIFRQLIFLQRAAEMVRSKGGIIAKVIGDSILAWFNKTTDSEDILKCAIEVVQGFENLQAYDAQSKIEAKVSLDFGLTYNSAIENNMPYDPIGFSVDRCARLNSIAQNNEIVVSEDFITVGTIKYPPKKFIEKYGFSEVTKELKGIGKTKYYCLKSESFILQ